MPIRKASDVCTIDEYNKLRDIQKRFERRSSLSESQRTKLAEDLRAWEPKITSIAWWIEYAEQPQNRKAVSYTVRDNIRILERVICGYSITPDWLKQADIYNAHLFSYDCDTISKNAAYWFHGFVLRLDREFQTRVFKQATEALKAIASNAHQIPDLLRLSSYKVQPQTRIQAEQKVEENKASTTIPLEYQSAPMSQKTLARQWGGDMTAKKLSGLMKSGRVRSEKLNRQTYIFDTRDLPKRATKEITK
ncbi:MAG: hypothetical protein CEE38_21935 [Planctomycetes bacterium B3_Pla]|nr:MAG: hypothetical protein CEE38_21935 [Planctomycetes bacterium B3_Pla]